MNSVVEELNKVLALGGLSAQFSHVICYSAIMPSGYRLITPDGEIEVPPSQVGQVMWELAEDGMAAAICSLVSAANPPKSAIGQLKQLVQFCWERSQESGSDLTTIKLEYRKVGSLVEVDIVSFTRNWWNFVDADGRKLRVIGGEGEYHEGPDIRTVEARFIYNPQSDILTAR